jgi:hypothetical protein
MALIFAFLAVWWVYDTYRPPQPPGGTPATEVVPPGYVPDPNYTWVPRSMLRQPPATITVTATPTATTATTPSQTTTTTTPSSSPPFPLPFVLPPPFDTGTTSPAISQPQPGPAPSALPP